MRLNNITKSEEKNVEWNYWSEKREEDIFSAKAFAIAAIPACAIGLSSKARALNAS